MSQLRVLLIPTANEYLLLPQNMLSHIYPYAPPMQVESASEFVIGGVLINNEKLPILDFDFGSPLPKRDTVDNSSNHLIMVKTTTTQSAYRSYAILSHGEPLLREISSESLEKVPKEGHPYVAQYVTLENSEGLSREIVILNLSQLEKDLSMS